MIGYWRQKLILKLPPFWIMHKSGKFKIKYKKIIVNVLYLFSFHVLNFQALEVPHIHISKRRKIQNEFIWSSVPYVVLRKNNTFTRKKKYNFLFVNYRLFEILPIGLRSAIEFLSKPNCIPNKTVKWDSEQISQMGYTGVFKFSPTTMES